MTCDICKGEQHQTWECPDARQAALDTFEALDIPSLRDGYMPVETAYLAALKRLAELEAELAEARAERDMLRNALARIRDYNPPAEMSHKAWRVRINVMRHWARKALARKGRKDGEG